MNPTASSLTRADNCTASAVLPQVYIHTIYSEGGHSKHGFLERVDKVGREAALLEIPDDDEHRELRQWCEQAPLDRLPKGGRREIACAWNSVTDTTVILGYNIGRAYRQRALEMGIDPDDAALWFGSIDIGGRAGDAADVSDLKTGWQRAGDAKTAEQLLFGSLALTRYYGVDRAVQRFLYVNATGKLRVDEAHVDDWDDLLPFADRLRALPPRIEKAREQVRLGIIPDTNPGTWCTNCKALRSCPAKASELVFALAAAQPLAGPPEGKKKITLNKAALEAMTPAALGDTYARALLGYKLLELVIAGIEDIAQLQPLPVPGGMELREEEVAIPTKVVVDVAAAVVKELYGEAAVAEVVKEKKTATLTDLTAMLRTRAERGQLASMERDLHQALRARSGLIEGTYKKVVLKKAGR